MEDYDNLEIDYHREIKGIQYDVLFDTDNFGDLNGDVFWINNTKTYSEVSLASIGCEFENYLNIEGVLSCEFNDEFDEKF